MSDLPDPLPGMIIEYEDVPHAPGEWVRTSIQSTRSTPTYLRAYTTGGGVVDWSPSVVREVRSADGSVLWRRGA